MNERLIGGLWCSQVLEQLDAYVDGSLAPTDLSAMQSHVAECDQCASFGASYAAVVGALRAGQSSADARLHEDRMARLRLALSEV